MTEERDAAVSRRYRELGAEEPPRALDDAILAAARRPARSWSRRWSVPLSLAAVVVLSVTVTFNLQREAPEMVTAQAPARPMSAPEPEPQAKAPEKAPSAAESAGVRDRAASKSAPQAGSSQGELAQQKPFAADPPAKTEASPPAEAAAAPPAAATAQARERASTAPLAKRLQVQETPEQQLERIALLRKEGRHDDADKALADFRKRLPDYTIPDSMLERVERR